MPGPKSKPMNSDQYDAETRELRTNAKANRKAKARLKRRQEDFDNRKAPEHGFDMHRPGSQNRRK